MSDVQSHAKGTGSKTLNRLNVKQIFELCKWLEDLQPTFDQTTTFEQLAVKASNHFKINITAYNVKGAFDTADMRLPQPPKTDNQKIAIIKRAIEQMAEAYGFMLPAEWSDL